MHTGSPWLSVAIHNAMLVGAHQYHQHPNRSNLQVVAKKRLWWSILLRDRIMPLALRRSPQIHDSNFDLSLDGLHQIDLQDEVQSSAVYDTRTKLLLLTVLFCQCQLALVLTRVLMICYNVKPPTQSKVLAEDQFVREAADITMAKGELATWFENTRQAMDSNLHEDDLHPSVALYSELTYMHYQYKFPIPSLLSMQ
jgi:hypothetical protein